MPEPPVPIGPPAPGRRVLRAVIGGRTVEFTVAVTARTVDPHEPGAVVEMPKRDQE
jgi:hypothetical protein